MTEQPKRKNKRLNNRAWKHIYGIDRRYTARVDRAIARGEYTPPTREQR